jgi:hypothetical protein
MNLLSIIIYAEDSLTINDSINSIYQFADQIIVISNDKISFLPNEIDITYQFINKHTTKAVNLNSALKLCNSKWVLYLNSGEQLITSDSINIRDLLSAANSNCGGFLCKMPNAHILNDSGPSTGLYPRLFLCNNSIDIFFIGFIFEQTSFSIIKSGKSIYPSEISIFSKESSQQLSSKESIAILSNIKRDLRDEYYWYELGLNYMYEVYLIKAEDSFINVFDYNNDNFYIRELASLALSNICRRTNRFEEAILWANIAYDISMDKTYSLQALANSHLWNNDLKNAKIYFQELEKTINQDTYKYYYTKFPQIVYEAALDEIRKLESE